MSRDAWASAKWYVRLGLQLLRERQLGVTSALAPWLAVLPSPADFKVRSSYLCDVHPKKLAAYAIGIGAVTGGKLPR